MLRNLMLALTIACFSAAAASAAPAGRFASAAEAKAMLEKAVAAVKTDKKKAFQMFDSGKGGFRDRDIFPFCFELTTGKVAATPFQNLIGKEMRNFRDAKGQPYGQQLLDAAKEGQINEVGYMFPRPGPDHTPVAKVAFVARVGDTGCAVGYYK